MFKRVSMLFIAALTLSACNPLADAYADRRLKSPTNTIEIPPVGYVSGNRSFNPGEQPERATAVQLTTDGRVGYVVCQHYLTSAAGKMDWVLYDDAEVVGTNVIQKYAKAHCMAEGYRIKAGAKPQDLHPTMGYVSNKPSETIGAAIR